MKKVKSLLFLFCIGLLVPIFCSAETVVLKSGQKVEGKVIEKTDKYIKIDIDGIPVTYFLDEIEAGTHSQASAESSQIEKKIKTDSGQTALFYFKKGEESFSLKKYKEAEEFFRQAAETDSAFEGFYYYALRGIQDFNQGVITEETGLLFLRGADFLFEKKPEDAIPVFEKILSSESNYALVYLALGACYSLLNQYEKALSNFKKCVQMDPSNGRAQFYVGGTLFVLGRFKEAQESLLKAKQIFEQSNNQRLAKEVEEYLGKLSRKETNPQ